MGQNPQTRAEEMATGGLASPPPEMTGLAQGELLAPRALDQGLLVSLVLDKVKMDLGTEWPKGSQAYCEVWREDLGLLSRPCRTQG